VHHNEPAQSVFVSAFISWLATVNLDSVAQLTMAISFRYGESAGNNHIWAGVMLLRWLSIYDGIPRSGDAIAYQRLEKSGPKVVLNCRGKYPPAKPGALVCEPPKAV